MSDHDVHHHQHISYQQKNEIIKTSITGQMKASLMNIYMVCSGFCVKDYKNKDLSDREKICLSRCFDRKNETLLATFEQFGKV